MAALHNYTAFNHMIGSWLLFIITLLLSHSYPMAALYNYTAFNHMGCFSSTLLYMCKILHSWAQIWHFITSAFSQLAHALSDASGIMAQSYCL
jgi:hypothetical protein